MNHWCKIRGNRCLCTKPVIRVTSQRYEWRVMHFQSMCHLPRRNMTRFIIIIIVHWLLRICIPVIDRWWLNISIPHEYFRFPSKWIDSGDDHGDGQVNKSSAQLFEMRWIAPNSEEINQQFRLMYIECYCAESKLYNSVDSSFACTRGNSMRVKRKHFREPLINK